MHRIAWLCGGLSILTVLGCGRRPLALPPSGPPDVVVSRPVVKTITEAEYFTGYMKSMRDVTVCARVTGYLDKVNFTEGRDVKQGDVLFEIDPRPYQAALHQAEASVAQSTALLERLKSSFDRAKRLLPQHAISQDDYDTVRGDRDSAEASLKAAQAALELAKLNLSFTRVTSPIDGRISNQKIDPGNMVQADQTPLTTIVAMDPMYAWFYVDERTELRIRRLIREKKIQSSQDAPMPVFMGLADQQGQFPYEGTINFVDNRNDAGSGTIGVRAIFPNPQRMLSPGLFARFRLPIGKPHSAVLIAEQALISDQGQKFVYLVNDKNEVVYRHVTPGSVQDGLCVIEDGLAKNEQVVVSGLQLVRHGMKVTPKAAETPAANPVTTTAPAAAPTATADKRSSS
jgi:membrane fusion protein, multidrug efflux system